MNSSTIIILMVVMAMVLTSQARKPKHPQCDHNPKEKCGKTNRKYVWTYNSNKNKCKEVRGCYQLDDNNVFNSKTRCKEVCVY